MGGYGGGSEIAFLGSKKTLSIENESKKSKITAKIPIFNSPKFQEGKCI